MIPLRNKESKKQNLSLPTNAPSSPGPAGSPPSIEVIIELVFDKFSQGIRFIGPIFAFALVLFVFIVVHAFFQIMLPYWIKNVSLYIGILLSAMTLFWLFNILFNYFLAVLVKPGSMEDIRKSKYYRKNDALKVSTAIINLNNVFFNSNNKSTDIKTVDDNKVQVKVRLKADSENADNIIKEESLLTQSNACNTMDDDEYEKQLDSKLSTLGINSQTKLDNLEANDLFMENNKQEEEINSYYNLNNSNLNSSVTSNNYRLFDCKYCKQQKPLRVHHCSICGYCVFKMDHHCPWINNCVGQNNHRYFVLFLTHLFFGCLHICLVSLPIVFNSDIRKTTEFHFVTVLSGVGMFLMVFFNSWNWFLIYKGNTTIEYWSIKANMTNPNTPIKDFSMPDWKDNLFLVFGTRSLLRAIFVPSIKRLPVSGLEWTKMAIPNYNCEITDLNHIEDAKISEEENLHKKYNYKI